MSVNPSNTSRNSIIIGGKPTMNYVVACMTLFNAGTKSCKVRARGRHISKAVDIVEMMRRVFLKDLIVDKIQIGTETMKSQSGMERSVSSIEIFITKP